jgi:hypothetical protein
MTGNGRIAVFVDDLQIEFERELRKNSAQWDGLDYMAWCREKKISEGLIEVIPRPKDDEEDEA